MEQPRPKIKCASPNCTIWAMRDGSGFCYNHNPAYREARQTRQKEVALQAYRKVRTERQTCKTEGFKGWPMNDSSGFCFNHNPAIAEERTALYTKRGNGWKLIVRPPERACKVKRCKGWTYEDGEGFCYAHKPSFLAKQRKRMKENKYHKGSHMPWLNLADFNEARALICYFLETRQALLTLRGLNKIISLHRRGEIYYPGKFGIYPNPPKQAKRKIKTTRKNEFANRNFTLKIPLTELSEVFLCFSTRFVCRKE